MSDHLDEAWLVVRSAFRTHGVEAGEDTCRAVSEHVGLELITRGLVLTFRAHAEATQSHCEALLDDLRAQNALLRRRLDEQVLPDRHPLTASTPTASKEHPYDRQHARP